MAQFGAAIEAGEHPDPKEYASRVPPSDRARVLSELQRVLDNPFRAADFAYARQEDPVRAFGIAAQGKSGLWPALIPAWRRLRGVDTATVAGQVADAVGFPDHHERVAEYLGALEEGQ